MTDSIDPPPPNAPAAAARASGGDGPLVSIVMATYNRAHTLPRAIGSVLAQDATCTDWELVVVDDGSTDGSPALLASLGDSRIRVVTHPENRGVTAAKNTGFDHARGAWVTTLDSDDELVPGALDACLGEPLKRDPGLDAIATNCIDSQTGKLTGSGFVRDQYIDLQTSMNVCKGEHWGLFHRRILGKNRLNPRVFGFEGILWNKIHDGARWYYLHRGLRVYHTEGDDRIAVAKVRTEAQADRLYRSYAVILDEEHAYLDQLRRLAPAQYRRAIFNAAGQFALHGDAERFDHASALLREAGDRLSPIGLRAGLVASPLLARARRALRR